jgi:death on curing protein
VTAAKFLTLKQVLTIHSDLIDAFGGIHGVRDQGLLESALAMPEATYGGDDLHPTIFDKAAAYLFHLVKNHPFLDGNKRVAAAVALTFLRANGHELTMSEDELYEFVIAVVEGNHGKEQIAKRFQIRSSTP